MQASEYLSDDQAFDRLYPEPIRALADEHWSPVDVAKEAAQYLVSGPTTRVLDIGSGAGKFCIVGAATTAGHFTGIEQRKNLVEVSGQIARRLELTNVEFVTANIVEFPFEPFDAFYFFNSFHENRLQRQPIDDQFELSAAHYARYSAHVTRALSHARPGTRLVTYWTCLWDIPSHFRRQHSAFDGLLDFWEKTV